VVSIIKRTYSGTWASKNIQFAGDLQPYATATVWGTGIDPIHGNYGQSGPPLRITGREGEEGSAGYEGRQTRPSTVPGELIPTELWGYRTVDNTYNDYIEYDDRPNWGEQPPEFRGNADGQPSGMQNDPADTATTGVNSQFRQRKGGAFRFNKKRPDSYPSETVTEGWRNKPKGYPADSQTSDPSQYEMQTSMQQRYRSRNNDHAVARATDDPREPIHSRVVGQKLKIYSGEERHYDMFPYQAEEIQRPFWFREAGTGDPNMMAPNEMFVATPVQRVPPADPSLGVQESEYGYTGEDGQYY
jgi:hypothetical protein